MSRDPKCPKCGNQHFEMSVGQIVDVQFGDDDHEVTDGPRGDMEWDDSTEAICKECGHADTLGNMNPLSDRPERVLPPDPENMNPERATWAAIALRSFMAATGADHEDAVSDLIANLHHYCDRNGLDFENELRRARNHYTEETAS